MARTRDFVQQLANISDSLAEMVDVLYQQAQQGGGSGDVLAAVEAQQSATVTMIEAIKTVSRDTRAIRSKTDEIHAAVQGMRRQRNDRSLLGDLGTGGASKKSIKDGVGSIILMAGGIMAIGAAFKLVGDVDFASVIALSIAMPLMAHAFAKIANTEGLSLKTVAFASLAIVGMSLAMAMSSWILQLTAPISINQALTIIVIAGTMAIAAYAVKTISQAMEGVSMSKIFMASAVMPFMAAGIVAAAGILTLTPTITWQQGLTAIAVAATMSVAAVGMAMLIKSLKGAKIQEMVFAGLAMPIIAAGLVSSAAILKMFPSVDVDVESTLKVALVMAGASLLMAAPIGAFTKLNLSPKDLAIGIIASVAMMGALAAGSHLIAMGDYSGGPSLAWAAGVGAAILAMTPAVAALGLMSMLNPLTIVFGVAGVIAMGGALAAVGSLVSMGDFSGGPTVGWATAFALSMVAMVPAVVVLGVPGMQLIAALGVASMLILAGGIVAIADVVRGGDYSGGPTVGWAAGIGMSLIMFGAALSSVSPGILGRIMGESTESRTESLVNLAGSLKRIADAVRGGDYSGGPKKEWSEGVGMALTSFTNAFSMIKPGLLDSLMGESTEGRIKVMVKMAGSLKDIALAVQGGKYDGGPSVDWANSIGGMVLNLAKAMAALDDEVDMDDVDGWMQVIKSMVTSAVSMASELVASDGGGVKKAADDLNLLTNAYMNLSKALVAITKSLKGYASLEAMPTLDTMTASLVAMSLIDSEKLRTVLDLLAKRTDGLQSIYSGAAAAQKSNSSFDPSGGSVWGNIGMPSGPSPAASRQVAPKGGGGGTAATPMQRQAAAPQDGPIKVISTVMERSLNNIDRNIAQLVSTVGDLLDEMRKPDHSAPAFGKK